MKKLGHFLKISTFAKSQHGDDYCLSLTQHLQSESCESVISVEKSDLGMAKTGIGQDIAQFDIFPNFQDKYFCSLE